MSTALSNKERLALNEQSAALYEKVLPELQALPAAALAPLNIDVESVVKTVLRALPRILKFAPRISRTLSDFDVRQLTRLREHVLALRHAQALFVAASTRSRSLRPLIRSALELRELLMGDLRALVHRGILAGAYLDGLKGAKRFEHVARDLRLLATIFHDNHAQIEHRCATKPEDLRRAEELADAILSAVAERDQATPAFTAAADIRLRAFTVVTRAYDQARRAITYLRWDDGDADVIAPSLYAGRQRGKRVRGRRRGRSSSGRLDLERARKK
jgi:hypothetical protein